MRRRAREGWMETPSHLLLNLGCRLASGLEGVGGQTKYSGEGIGSN